MSSIVTMTTVTSATSAALTVLTLCAICGSSDLVIPCVKCFRSQCEACMTEEGICRGCQVDQQLDLDPDSLSRSSCSSCSSCLHCSSCTSSSCSLACTPPSISVSTTPSTSRSSSESSLSPSARSFSPSVSPFAMRFHAKTEDLMVWHYMEMGMIPHPGLMFPSKTQWKTVESILMSYIQYTTSNQGIQSPILGYKYLVGSAPHRYPNGAYAQTDYIMMYEYNLTTETKEWMRYMVTYYDQTPMRHDKNVFYPLPLPLQFD